MQGESPLSQPFHVFPTLHFTKHYTGISFLVEVPASCTTLDSPSSLTTLQKIQRWFGASIDLAAELNLFWS